MGIVDADKRCVRCLGRNHASADCRRAQPCRTCGEPHHTALCPGPKTPAPAAATTRDSTVVAPTLAATAQVFGDIFLKTATVLIDASSGPRRAICLVDEGSQRSFMRRELAEELGLPVEGQEMIAVQAFGSNEATTPEMLKRRRITIRGTFPNAAPVELRVLDKQTICPAPPYGKTDFANDLWNKGYQLADDRFLGGGHSISEIDILIGADHVWQVCLDTTISHSEGLRAIDSKLGWLLLGPSASRTVETPTTTSAVVTTVIISALQWSISCPLPSTLQDDTPREQFAIDQSVEQASPTPVDEPSGCSSVISQDSHEETAVNEDSFLPAFWAIEHLGISCPDTDQGDELLEDYEDQITRSPDGRYNALLPWKADKWLLQPNRWMAEGRLASLMRRLKRQPQLLADYHREIHQWQERGFIAPATSQYDGPHCYLPHHPVICNDKSTTKIHPVFDRSASTKEGPSLNNRLETGPNLNPELLAVLLRFRKYRIAWIADIEQAFLNIALPDEDAESVRFLWYDDPTDPVATPTL